MKQVPRYPKTQSLWKRNMATFCDCADLDFPNNVLKCPACGEKTSKVDGYGLIMPGNYTWRMFENISRWHVTEKIHGQNIRIGWNPDMVQPMTYWGRKGGESSIQKGLLPYLKDLFTPELIAQAFDEDTTGVVLYGEGYGPGIQSWHYGLDRSEFILFDVLVGNVWLEQSSVTEVADKLGIKGVPILGENMSTVDAVMKCYGEPWSQVALGHPMEGVVARSQPLVLHRVKKTPIQWKLKVSDYVKLKEFRETGTYENTKGGV